MPATTIRTNEVAIRNTRTASTPTVPSPFKWLRDLNAMFVAFHTFKDLSAAQLRDMGITKRQQDEAFLRQFAPRNDR